MIAVEVRTHFARHICEPTFDYYVAPYWFNMNNELCWASEYGYLEYLKYLVSIGADIHAGGDYAIRYAAAHGHLDTVKYLISIGANVHVCNNIAYFMAADNDHLKVAQYLKPMMIMNKRNALNRVRNKVT